MLNRPVACSIPAATFPGGFRVSGIWRSANALLVAERRSVLPPADSDLFLARLNGLPIRNDTEPTRERGARLLALARAHGLSSYDATYLELAQRLNATLASFDRPLNRAAAAIGVALFGGGLWPC